MKSIAAITNENFSEYIQVGTTTFLLPLKDFSVSYEKTYNLKEIKEIKTKYSEASFFVVMNRMIFNRDIPKIRKVLRELEKLSLEGIFFYDLALLELKKEEKFQTPLVWNATHMVTNSKTCNYYLENGVDYASISGELSKKEMRELIQNTKIKLIYSLVCKPVVAHSKRKLITNYEKSKNSSVKNQLKITEPVTRQDYLVREEKEGTSFFYNQIPNHFSMLEDLEVEYVLLNESLIPHDVFLKLLQLTNQYIKGELSYQEIRKESKFLLKFDGPFLEHETIYRVKKGEKE